MSVKHVGGSSTLNCVSAIQALAFGSALATLPDVSQSRSKSSAIYISYNIGKRATVLLQ